MHNSFYRALLPNSLITNQKTILGCAPFIFLPVRTVFGYDARIMLLAAYLKMKFQLNIMKSNTFYLRLYANPLIAKMDMLFYQ